jgi:hypothetical protein
MRSSAAVSALCDRTYAVARTLNSSKHIMISKYTAGSEVKVGEKERDRKPGRTDASHGATSWL